MEIFFIGIIIILIMLLINGLTFVSVEEYIYRTNYHIRKEYKYVIVFTGCILNFICAFILHRVIVGYWNFIVTINRICLREITYQEFDIIPILILLCIICAFIIGCMMRLMISRCIDGVCNSLKNIFKSKHFWGIFSSLVLMDVCFFYFSFSGSYQLHINEVYVNNEESYVEIRNNGILPCEVYQKFLSDDINNLSKLEIPTQILGAGKTAIVLIDESSMALGKGGGDEIVLSDVSGSIIGKVVTGEQIEGTAYCKDLEEGEWKNMKPTPGMNNLCVEAPQFTVEGGFYSTEFDLELFVEGDYPIYYTVDSSVPTEKSILYKDAIRVYDRSSELNQYKSIPNVVYDWLNAPIDHTPVEKAFVVRAVAIGPEGQMSEVVTNSYLIDKDYLKDGYVVSIVADPDDLFGANGIYSTGQVYDYWYLNGQEGEQPVPNFEIRDLERVANMELFDKGSLSINQLTGISIQGGSQRFYRFKRLSVFSREEYSGSEIFENEIFEDDSTHSVTLRAGFDNAFVMGLVEDRNVATQRCISVAFFLNGEWWENTYMQEKYNNSYFLEHYGLENVEYYKKGITQEIEDFLMNNDLADDDAYEEFGRMIDIQSYIDYICINAYLGNTDDSEYGGNTLIWRSRNVENDSYGDGRWRWGLYDMDLITEICRSELGMNDITDAQFNTFKYARSWTVPINQRVIFSNLKKNENFKEQFVLSFMDLVNTNFSISQVEEELGKWSRDIGYNNCFYAERAQYITEYMKEEFGLIGTKEKVSITINDSDAGEIVVNTCKPNLENGVWSGEYYTDYPITVSVIENEGYSFVGWEGDINTTSSSMSVELIEGGLELRAIFEKDN